MHSTVMTVIAGVSALVAILTLIQSISRTRKSNEKIKFMESNCIATLQRDVKDINLEIKDLKNKLVSINENMINNEQTIKNYIERMANMYQKVEVFKTDIYNKFDTLNDRSIRVEERVNSWHEKHGKK